MSKKMMESTMAGAPMNIRPSTPKSALILHDKKIGRDAWAHNQTQGYIHERGKLREAKSEYGQACETPEQREYAETIRKREVNFISPQSRINHKMPSLPDIPAKSPSTSNKLLKRGSSQSGSFALDQPPEEKPWRGNSLANQRYQYHVLLSRVNLQDSDVAQDEGHLEWNEKTSCTGGAKTDSLIPGSSHSNGVRWAPTVVNRDLLTKTAPFRQGTSAPNTSTEYIQAARQTKEEIREKRERRRVYLHAKKQGVQDVDNWLLSVGHATASAKSVPAFVDSSNRWNKEDKNEWLQVSRDGLSVRAGYKSIQDRNGMVRANHCFYSGRHFWKIILDSFDVVGQGWHVVGVAAKEDPLVSEVGHSAIASGDGAGLYLEHCQKVRGSNRPQEYGKRAVKAGDVIGVLLDLDLGELSFFVNGEDLGVAFYGMRGPLYPAVEMGMMVGQHHQYSADFSAPPPTRRRMEAPPISDEEAFARISGTLPRTSKKFHQEGFGTILSVPSTMPHKAPGGINHRITSYPQLGDHMLSGSGPSRCAVAAQDQHLEF